MSQDPTNFDDPALREAIRGSTRPHRASDALRARVATAMAATPVPRSSQDASGDGDEAETTITLPASSTPRVRRLWTMAAAVVVAGLCVVAARTLYDEFAPRERVAVTYSDDSIWAAMVKIQDAGASTRPDETAVAVDLADPQSLASAASARLGRRVPAPSFPGWTVEAANYTTVGGLPAVRFRVRNATNSASVLSMPESAWTYRNSDDYSTCVDGHHLAGFVADGGLHCVVGDRELSSDQVQQLANDLRRR